MAHGAKGVPVRTAGGEGTLEEGGVAGAHWVA